jgi:predicted lipid-binding transport protein (Tim44 family)
MKTMTANATHASRARSGWLVRPGLRKLVRRAAAVALAGLVPFLLSGVAHAEDKPVYRCPGNLYTDALSAKEAQDKGCKTLDGAPITVIQSILPKSPNAGAKPAGAAPGAGDKVGAEDQKARDSDARRILEAELRKAEEALAALQKDYNNGQPERLGDERNFQKYQDRVNEMKAAITRKESDVAALKRELAKFGVVK